MKTLYIECNMGAAGDMLTAALLELIEDRNAFLAQMNGAGIPGLRMSVCEKTTCGIRGTHMDVLIDGKEEIVEDVDQNMSTGHCGHHQEHAHHHNGIDDVEAIVKGTNLPQSVKDDAMNVYRLIAEAEANAHGKSVEHIHFHELGMMDAIADISAVCLLMHMIAPEKVVVSPICTGYGEVRCMHGIMPVPTPATAYLLQGVPNYAGRTRGELLTPTGMALLKYYADEFAQRPMMRIEKTGAGIGTKEFETANCVRAMLGDSGDGDDTIVELKCNLDDMTAEQIAFAAEILMENGALDVYCIPILMKKGRPATMLCCMCKAGEVQRFAELTLRHTTTLGVRASKVSRYTLDRTTRTVHTRYGDIAVKTARGCDICRSKPEYSDCAAAAKQYNVAIAEVVREVEKNI